MYKDDEVFQKLVDTARYANADPNLVCVSLTNPLERTLGFLCFEKDKPKEFDKEFTFKITAISREPSQFLNDHPAFIDLFKTFPGRERLAKILSNPGMEIEEALVEGRDLIFEHASRSYL